MRTLISISLALFIISCQLKSQNFRTIKIEASTDSCYKLTNPAFRKMEILENTLDDTIALGFAILLPKVTKRFNYLRLDEKVDRMIDPETPETLMPMTKMICVNLYKKRAAKGYILIKYQVTF